MSTLCSLSISRKSSLFLILAVGFLCTAACSDSNKEPSASGASGDGDGDGDEGSEHSGAGGCTPEECGILPPSLKRPDGCVGAPPADWQPSSHDEWDPPEASILVTSTADSGEGSLRAALEQAKDGDVIAFEPALKGESILLESELIVSASITLDGSAAPGLTLDGQEKTRVLRVEKNHDTKFVALRIVNGKAEKDGGGINVRQADEGAPERHVEVIGCHFENNVAEGGALLIGWRVNAIVRNSVFVRNDGRPGESGKSGGAISTRQDASSGLIVERCRFVENRGHVSGAVYNILQPLEITDSVFMENTAVAGSGAVFTDGGNTVGPSNDPVSGEEGHMVLRRVWMEGNRGAGEGGSVLLWGYPRDKTVMESVVIKDSLVEKGGEFGNSKGGAARLHGLSEMNISNSSFVGNTATQQGGALWVDGTGDFVVENSLFADNQVLEDAGGAITYNGKNTQYTINSSAFVRNRAGRACGALWWAAGDQDLQISNSFFALNDSSDLSQRHMRGPSPPDGGGNLEWVTSEASKGRVWQTSAFADPQLAELTSDGSLLYFPFDESSPLADAATESAAALDARGAKRGSAPDIGPFELGASCK